MLARRSVPRYSLPTFALPEFALPGLLPALSPMFIVVRNWSLDVPKAEASLLINASEAYMKPFV